MPDGASASRERRQHPRRASRHPFAVGDLIVHPARGEGRVSRVREHTIEATFKNGVSAEFFLDLPGLRRLGPDPRSSPQPRPVENVGPAKAAVLLHPISPLQIDRLATKYPVIRNRDGFSVRTKNGVPDILLLIRRQPDGSFMAEAAESPSTRRAKGYTFAGRWARLFLEGRLGPALASADEMALLAALDVAAKAFNAFHRGHKKRSKTRRRSIWTVSGGLPSLGRRR